MKKTLLFLSIFIMWPARLSFAETNLFNEPDSVYIFAYTLSEKSGDDGLRFAWSADKKNWNPLDHKFLQCDYGPWVAEKKMYSPYLFMDNDGLWHCVWNLNDKRGGFAHSASSDLIFWHRQSYPIVIENNNCLEIEASYEEDNRQYIISFLSVKGADSLFYFVTTTNFKNYTPAKPIHRLISSNLRVTLMISDKPETGTIHKVPRELVNKLIKTEQDAIQRYLLSIETPKDDSIHFAGLNRVNVSITINASERKKISDMLIGVFFEDINYAADGGLYAELVQNRGFEYNGRGRNDTTWNSKTAWTLNGSYGEFVIDTVMPVHPNNKHYAILNILKKGSGLVNEGFDSIAVKKGDKYFFSLFARNLDDKDRKLLIRLVGKKGEVYGEATVNANSSNWKKFESEIIGRVTATDAHLEIIPQVSGNLALDMISLFPEKTFKRRRNGLRADLAQTIIDINPRFLRFPGGCVAHGSGLDNIYHWKNTIGPLEARKPQFNLWGYHQSFGLGYFEYFQFCEDIGAVPVPVVAAGVPCQNSPGGQQGGIPMCKMGNYIQDVLDLIEWTNGDVNTVWGRKRAEAGHPEPFNLKYLGIGNEDLISDIFEERFTMIYEAVKEKYPEIIVIGTGGPFSEGTDYVEGWALATKLGLPMVDEHYYKSPGWFIYNQDFYDKYDRTKSKVYLGEYASWGNSLYNALAEAIYLTAIERNGDVVCMASYAPLLAKEGHTQWNTDLIYFNNTTVKPTVNYYVQQLYGRNAGDEYLDAQIYLKENCKGVKERVSVSAVRDSKSGDIIVKLVNLLPVSVNASLQLKDIGLEDCTVTKTILSGKPDDKQVSPVSSEIELKNNDIYEMPAYSFTIIRIKASTVEKKQK